MTYTQTIVLIVLFIIPFLLWRIYRTNYGKKFFWSASDKNKSVPIDNLEIIMSKTDKQLIDECKLIIHYFDLQGKDVSPIPLNVIAKPVSIVSVDQTIDFQHQSNPSIHMNDNSDGSAKTPFTLDGVENIVTGLTGLEKALKNNSLEEKRDRSLLYLIYDYLSAALSNYDNDITVETIHEAVDKNSSKYANYNYAFGAVYILALTITLHAYMTSLGNDNSEAKKLLAKYSFILSFPVDSINKIIRDSTNKDHAKMLNAFDSASYVDSVVIQRSLSANIRWIYNQVSLYPVTGRLRDGEEFGMFPNKIESLDSHQLLFVSSEWIYLSDQLVNDFRKYILPMLYGLIGSFLWVIRKMSDQVKSYDLTWKKLIRHRARLVMGLFVGMFFGYLFKSNEISSTYTITPFVAAFIGGYQVEILFTLMDKIIATFSNTETGGKGKSAQQTKPA